eukprot:1392054-Amorphochlora_amoeboformis.AAC.1
MQSGYLLTSRETATWRRPSAPSWFPIGRSLFSGWDRGVSGRALGPSRSGSAMASYWSREISWSTGVSSSSVVTSTFVAASPLVIHPQVVISGRSVFSFCEKVTLTSTSSSGSLGKPYLAYNWTLVSATPNNTASAESVLNISTPTLSLSFYPGKYTVRLNLTNWMGASSFGEYSFVVSPDISPVITSSYPLTFNVSRSDSLIISSDSRIPSCGNSTLTGLDGDFVRRSKWTQLIPNTTEATAAAEAAGSSRAAGFMRLTSHRVTIQGANSATLQVNMTILGWG